VAIENLLFQQVRTPVGTEDRETSRNGRSAQVCIGQLVVILRGIGQRFLERVCLSCPPGVLTCGNIGPKIFNLSIQISLMVTKSMLKFGH
jgi:hypothetical protein